MIIQVRRADHSAWSSVTPCRGYRKAVENGTAELWKHLDADVESLLVGRPAGLKEAEGVGEKLS